MRTLSLSVLICTYNRRSLLSHTLPALFHQDFPHDACEIIVVDDGSTDGTGDFLSQLKSRFSLITCRMEKNAGPSAARNRGLQIARGDIVLVLDDDIRCGPGLFQAHVQAHSSATESAVIFGPVLVDEASPSGTMTDLQVRSEDYRSLNAGKQPAWPHEIHLDANSSVLRSILLAVGGWDESFRRTRENVDIGLRLWDAGVRFKFLSSAIASQIYVKNADDFIRDASWYGRMEVALVRKHGRYRPFSTIARIANAPLSLGIAVSLFRPFSSLAERVLQIFSRAIAFLPRSRAQRDFAVFLVCKRRTIALWTSAISACGGIRAMRRGFHRRLPVLLYHRIDPVEEGGFPELCVSAERFERHLDLLQSLGYRTISAKQWLAWCNGELELPQKIVALTFDDAYEALHQHALPALQARGMTATIFVVSGCIGKINEWDVKFGSTPVKLLSEEQIRFWSEQGFEFGGHTVSHPDLRKSDASELMHELGSCHQTLQAVTGEVVSFAYPFGHQNDRVRAATSKHYRMAFTVARGVNRLTTDVYRLHRSMVQPGDGSFALRCRLWLGSYFVERFRHFLGRTFRRIFWRKA